MTKTLTLYRQLYSEVDAWFSACLQAGGAALACHGGCSACCRGLFDITLLDAWLLKEAFAELPDAVRRRVLERCQPRLAELQQRWPELKNPYLLNALPEEEWSEMPEDDLTPCPLLDDSGFCLVYDSRPLTCRLHGLPNIDVSGEDFEGVFCTLHPGVPDDVPNHLLRWRFRDVFSTEVELFQRFTEELSGRPWQELDTFIPLALLADYDSVDWRRLKL